MADKYKPGELFVYMNGGYSGGGCAFSDVTKCAERIKKRIRAFGWKE